MTTKEKTNLAGLACLDDHPDVVAFYRDFQEADNKVNSAGRRLRELKAVVTPPVLVYASQAQQRPSAVAVLEARREIRNLEDEHDGLAIQREEKLAALEKARQVIREQVDRALMAEILALASQAEAHLDLAAPIFLEILRREDARRRLVSVDFSDTLALPIFGPSSPTWTPLFVSWKLALAKRRKEVN